jgi:hypothetical protein
MRHFDFLGVGLLKTTDGLLAQIFLQTPQAIFVLG